MTTDQKEMTKIIENYYQDLYTEKGISDQNKIEHLQKHNKIKFTTQQKEILNEPITISEIRGNKKTKTSKQTKNRKSPGSNGIPAEYYKDFEEILNKPY